MNLEAKLKKIRSISLPLGNRHDRPMGFSDSRKKKEGTLRENFANTSVVTEFIRWPDLLFGHLSQPSFISVFKMCYHLWLSQKARTA